MHRGSVQEAEIDSDTLSDVVVIPVAVAAATNGDVPLAGTSKRREGLDCSRNVLSIFWLKNTPWGNLSNC